METRVYTVAMLRQFINESMNEFEPKLGDDVTKNNKRNNAKAIKDMNNDTSKYDGGLTDKKPKHDKLGNNGDYNKNMLDVQFNTMPPKKYVDRVKAQVHGYPSVDNEKLHEKEDDNDTTGNGEIYDNAKSRNKEVNAHQVKVKKAGLKSKEMPVKQFDSNSVFENNDYNKNVKMKKLNFKRTKFLSEKHMLSRIPDEYKVNGNKFIMQDSDENEYLIEWVVSDKYLYSEAKILSHTNKRKLNEDMDKINKLIGYKSSDYFETTNPQMRLNENYQFGKMINNIKSKYI